MSPSSFVHALCLLAVGANAEGFRGFSLEMGSGGDIQGPQASASSSGGGSFGPAGYDGGAGCNRLEDELKLTRAADGTDGGEVYVLQMKSAPCLGSVRISDGVYEETHPCSSRYSTTYESTNNAGDNMVMTLICDGGTWTGNGLLLKKLSGDAVATYSVKLNANGESRFIEEEGVDGGVAEGGSAATCGTASVGDGRRLGDKGTTVITELHPVHEVGRKLKYDRFENCYDGDTKLNTMRVGFTVGATLYKKLKGNKRTTEQYVSSILEKVNKMFEGNFNVRLVLGHLVMNPSDMDIVCSDKSSGQLNKLRNWPKPSQQAMWHHLDDCFGSDDSVIGLAYVGTVCDTRSGYNTGLSWDGGFWGSTWKTVAHEIGHNFGGSHSFEEGQGDTGGIMDYGNGWTGGWRGEVQFNKQYRHGDMCANLKTDLKKCSTELFQAYDEESNPWNKGNAAPASAAPLLLSSAALCALLTSALAL